MRQHKKLIIGAVLVGVLLFASLGGIALAQDDEDNSQPGTLWGSLWDKVSAIYEQKTGDTLDQEALQEAINQARSEFQTEAMKNRLDALVEQGKINQQQADDYLEWQQAKPEGMSFELGGHCRHGMGGFHFFGGPPETRQPNSN